MTREEQRRVRELKKPFAQACRNIGKARGWKTIAGYQYQVRDGVLYQLYLSLPPSGGGRAASARLSCKPLALDDLFWEIFHMTEAAGSMPFSFHVNGAFTAWPLQIGHWGGELGEGLETSVERLFREAEEKVGEHLYPDIPAFREAAAQVQGQTLNVILCLLLEKRYEEASRAIGRALERHEHGGFARATEDGCVDILEDARDWCARRLEEKAPWSEERP